LTGGLRLGAVRAVVGVGERWEKRYLLGIWRGVSRRKGRGGSGGTYSCCEPLELLVVPPEELPPWDLSCSSRAFLI